MNDVSPPEINNTTDWPEWALDKLIYLQNILHYAKRSAYEEREREMARIELAYRKEIDRLSARYTKDLNDLIVQVKKEQAKEGKD